MVKRLLKVGIVFTFIGVGLNLFGFFLSLMISDWGIVTNFYETFIYVSVIVAV